MAQLIITTHAAAPPPIDKDIGSVCRLGCLALTSCRTERSCIN